MPRSPQEVFQHHAEALGAGDLDAIVDDYSDDGGGQWTLRASGNDIEHGLDEPVKGPIVSQRYRIGDLGERWMPAAFEPVSVSLHDTLVVQSSRTLVTDQDTVHGLRYEVDSTPPPTTVELACP